MIPTLLGIGLDVLGYSGPLKMSTLTTGVCVLPLKNVWYRYSPLSQRSCPVPCRQHPDSQTQSQSSLAVQKGHLLFLTFLFPAAQRSKDISLVAVPVIGPNGCGPLAQGLEGQAAEGQRTSVLSLRIGGKREGQEDLPHPSDRGLRVFPPSAARSALLGVPKSHPAWRRNEEQL